jgi:hypothetical protein
LSGELDRSGERIGAGTEEARGNAARKHLRHVDGRPAADRLKQVDAGQDVVGACGRSDQDEHRCRDPREDGAHV